MLASAYSTSDSQSNSPNLFVTTTTTTANGDSPLFSIHCTLIGSPSNTNATSNPNPMHEHNLEGSEHDGKEGAGEGEEEDRLVLTITVAPVEVGGEVNTHNGTVASGGIKKPLPAASASSRLDRRWCWRGKGGRWGG